MSEYTATKDSGIEWIGAIPATWKTHTLYQLVTQVKNKNSDLQETNLLSLSYGKIKRRDINSNGGLLPESFNGYNIIEDGDIVLRLPDLQNDHTSLRVGLATERGIITSAYTTLRPIKKETSRYLYYLLHSFDIKKGFYGMGSGVRQGLNYDEVKELRVILPSDAEQSAIVSYLDEQCAKIDNLIDESKSSISMYTSWKASIISETVTNGINPASEMHNSGTKAIGMIPRQWSKTKIGRVAIFYNGDRTSRYPKPDDFVDEGIPFINSTNLNSDVLDLSTAKYITREKYDSLSGAKLEINDIVYCLRGSVGKCAINITENAGTVASSLMTIRAVGIHSKYLLYVLLSNVAKVQTDICMNGTCAANLSAESVSNYIIPLPTTNEQNKIVEKLDYECSKIDSLLLEKQELIRDLEEYKRSLIFEVVTGKRKVV